VIAEMRVAAAQSLKNTRVLFVPDAGAAGEIAQFKAAAVGDVRAFAGTPALLEQFRAILGESLMGTRLYVAGPENFIGLVMKIALEFNLNKDEIRAEECGTLARRVYCIHCRTTTENVRTNIVRCDDCERWLLVRDHYSRRLAAYMGVMVDAEAPGELPPLKEVFL
jgi:dimethylamine monooxygenase subunit C